MDQGTRGGGAVATGTGTWAADAVRPLSVPPPGRPLPETGDVLGGRFFLRRLLGEGATGVVFAALDHATRRDVAVKLLRPETVSGNGLERLRREVRLSQPGHPAIVRLHDLHEVDGFLLLSMELVEGRTLQALVAERGPLPVDTAVAVGRSVAAALAYLHEKGLVHRDVKPGNVLVTDAGDAKLCDLGLLRPVEHGLTVTATHAVVGTPAYMAPEQAVGHDLTGAADVYGLGLTLWQALTGKVPLLGSSAIETLTRRQKEVPPPLRPDRAECPRWLERLLRRMLAPRPAERPDARQVEAALGTLRFRPRPRTRHLVAAAAAAVAALALALGGRALASRRTVRFDRAGKVVHGVDARGRPTWSASFQSPVRQMAELDLDGDGTQELVAVAYGSDEPATRVEQRPLGEVAVFSASGAVLTRVHPEEVSGTWEHTFAKRFDPVATAVDLDGDGWKELLLNCPHTTYFPDELLVYWPRTRTWESVLSHAGHIDGLEAIPGATPRIRLLARNNALGMAAVFGELSLVPPGTRRAVGAPGRGSMALAAVHLESTAAAAIWSGYTLLPRGAEGRSDGTPPRFESQPDGSVVVDLGPDRIALDPRLNPTSGPNRGKDLTAMRLEFLSPSGPTRIGPGGGGDAGSIAREVGELRERFRPLLTEPAYRLAFDVASAERLTRAGVPGKAAALLRETTTVVEAAEAPYRLAVALSLAGELGEASRILRDLVRGSSGNRGMFDAPELLLRIGVERRSDEDVALAIEALWVTTGAWLNQPGLDAALHARAALLQDRPTEADTRVGSCRYAPDGDAIAVLSRWRLGRLKPGDARAMELFVGSAPEAETEGRLALAAARSAAGRPGEAVDLCDELIRKLEPGARTSFEQRQKLQLARAIHAGALLAAGQRATARREAEQLVAATTPRLLPANLAREVLAALDRDPGASR